MSPSILDEKWGRYDLGVHQIWLIQTWEPNPLDDLAARPMRTGILAHRLRARGHEVTWWASQFSHKTGAMRRPTLEPVTLPNGTTMRLMSALGYERNVSFRRLKDHRHVAADFLRQARELPKPDVVVLSYPPIESGIAAVAYCVEQGVPLLVDVRDQYPDLYWLNRPPAQQRVAKALSGLAGFQRDARRVLGAAHGLTANGDGALDWALDYAARPRGPNDAVVPMSFEPPACQPEALRQATQQWLERYPEWAENPVFLYAGALGQTLDVERLATLCKAAEHAAVRVAICGSGDRQADIESLANSCRHTAFLGNLDSVRLAGLQHVASWGLVPYRASANFEGGIPNKPVECIAQGLPILSTITKGRFAEIAHEAGVSFSWDAPETAIQRAIEMRGQREILRQKAVETFNAHFHPDRSYQPWIELIERCADRPR